MTKRTLPKVERPTFPITLPVSGKKTTYTTFSVKEEKILLLAKESGDIDHIITAFKQVIENCLQGVSMERLPLADVEYAMLKMRSSSINNQIDFTIRDPQNFEEVALSVDLSDVSVYSEPEHTNIIKVGESMFVKMRYPTIDEFAVLLKAKTDAEKHYDIMIGCMDEVINGEEMYSLKDFSREDIDEFVDGFSETDIAAMKQFFATMPRLRHSVNYVNSDGKNQTFVIEGLEAFFV